MALGRVLRRTRRVRRGLGGIRQDLNVSIAAGDRVESKAARTSIGFRPSSVSRWLASCISIAWPTTFAPTSTSRPSPHRDDDDASIERQVAQAVAEHLPLDLHDVSALFSTTQSGMIADGLSGGSLMMALPLKGLLGRLGTKTRTTTVPNCPVSVANWQVPLSWPA